MADSIKTAIICSRQSDIIDLVRKLLKANGVTEITALSEYGNCIDRMAADEHAALILDWAIGTNEACEILESTLSEIRIGTRPILLISRSEIEGLAGVALEYSITQLHQGPVSHDALEKLVKTLAKTKIQGEEVKEAMHNCASARKRNDYTSVISILTDLMSRHSEDPSVASELAEAYMQSGDTKAAVHVLEPFTKLPEKNPRILNIQGRCLARMGKFEEATIMLQQADLINPYNVRRLVGLGDAYLQLDNPNRAKDNFDRALQIDPKSKDAKKGVGQSLLLMGEINDALEFIRQISEASEMASVFNMSAVIAIRNSRFEDGMKLYRVACKTIGDQNQPILAKLAFNMGLAQFRMGVLDKAFYYFQVSTRLDPSYQKAANAKAAVSKKIDTEKSKAIDTPLMDALLRDGSSEQEADPSGDEEPDELADADADMRRKEDNDYDMEF